MARPTELDPVVVQRICDWVTVGNYVEWAARATGVSPASLYRWLRQGKADLAPVDDPRAKAARTREIAKRAWSPPRTVPTDELAKLYARIAEWYDPRRTIYEQLVDQIDRAKGQAVASLTATLRSNATKGDSRAAIALLSKLEPRWKGEGDEGALAGNTYNLNVVVLRKEPPADDDDRREVGAARELGDPGRGGVVEPGPRADESGRGGGRLVDVRGRTVA